MLHLLALIITFFCLFMTDNVALPSKVIFLHLLTVIFVFLITKVSFVRFFLFIKRFQNGKYNPGENETLLCCTVGYCQATDVCKCGRHIPETLVIAFGIIRI